MVDWRVSFIYKKGCPSFYHWSTIFLSLFLPFLENRHHLFTFAQLCLAPLNALLWLLRKRESDPTPWDTTELAQLGIDYTYIYYKIRKSLSYFLWDFFFVCVPSCCWSLCSFTHSSKVEKNQGFVFCSFISNGLEVVYFRGYHHKTSRRKWLSNIWNCVASINSLIYLKIFIFSPMWFYEIFYEKEW